MAVQGRVFEIALCPLFFVTASDPKRTSARKRIFYIHDKLSNSLEARDASFGAGLKTASREAGRAAALMLPCRYFPGLLGAIV